MYDNTKSTPFSAEYRETYGLEIVSKNLRSLRHKRGEDHRKIWDLRKEVFEDCVQDPNATTAAFVFSGMGSGKSALVKHLQEFQNLRSGGKTIIDENATSRSSGERIQKALDTGKNVIVYFVSCPP